MKLRKIAKENLYGQKNNKCRKIINHSIKLISFKNDIIIIRFSRKCDASIKKLKF